MLSNKSPATIRPQPEKPWIPEIERARELVNQGESKRKVAKYLGIPESTLRKRLKKISRPSSGVATFTPELEEELVRYCTAFNDMSGGLTFTALRKIAYNFAEENHIENTFDKNIRMADVEFMNDFLSRHATLQKAIRNPSGGEEISKDQLGYFFDCLKEQLLTHQFNASRIYNVTLLDVSVLKTDKTTDNISAILAASASAHYIPPAFVFHGHGFNLELLNGAPPCSIAIPSNLDIFLEWLRHFQKHVHSSHHDPVLLVLNDNTFSHSKCVLELCKFHGIVLLNLPSYRLQPLSRTVLSSFRVFYAVEQENWCKLHHTLTHRHVASVFRRAYFRSATMEAAVEGFRMAGICPFDRDVCGEQTSEPQPQTQHNHAHQHHAPPPQQQAPPPQPTNTTPATQQLCHTMFGNVVCEYEEQLAAAAAAQAAAHAQGAQAVCVEAELRAVGVASALAAASVGNVAFTDMGQHNGPEVSTQ